ncbi:hypothetical protein [Spirosoma endophyticum]|uniref:Uncharacterized protein n=1 Tax=Spirosoma endophyticum TaxID=662367 RepID=A0A1I2D8I4_9BACT|nr:hypothetical protein [Spirosoma endophyticum]SFE76403.1 hypothetical protein SAMN05216167_11933 [Spirosoma endophyticum]
MKTKSIKFLLLVFLVLPASGYPQSQLVGLGRYVIGVTTPDSLNSTDFQEQEQAYVKGTLTLPCTHIRSFKSNKVQGADVLTTNLLLLFYDNKLFKLICDYPDELKAAFLAKNGNGISRPARHVQVGVKNKSTSLVLTGEVWQNADIEVLAVHYKGDKADYQIEETDRLMIASKTISALASDCDLQNVEPLIEEFDKMLNDHRDQHPERRTIKQIRKP